MKPSSTPSNTSCEEPVAQVWLELPEGVSLVSSDAIPSVTGGTSLYRDNMRVVEPVSGRFLTQRMVKQ